MIFIDTNQDTFQYDIHALVKAFFPEEEVKVRVGADDELPEQGDMLVLFDEIKKSIHIRLYPMRVKQIKETADDDPVTEDLTGHDRQDNVLHGDISYTGSLTQNKSRESRISEASTNGTSSSLSTPKNALKQLLYRLLVQATGRELPWGSLTGIRPTKITTNLLRQNKNEKEIINYLKNVYSVSDSKISLSLQIAKTEKSVLEQYPYESGYTLYVGIPFCPTRCGYCSFAAVPVKTCADLVPVYLSCLKRELYGVSRLMAGKRLDTVYIGGGTPTALSAAELDELIFYMESLFDMSTLKEFTVEAGRPDSILDDPHKLRRLKEHRVNRICVNPQTFVQQTLDTIGREHSVQETEEAFYMARSEGFNNINMDIIVGLPGEGVREMRTTAEHLLHLRPDDLTIHSLAVKRGSAMQAKLSEALESVKSGREKEDVLFAVNPVKSDVYSISTTAQMMEIAENCALEMELLPYYLYRQKNMTGNMENTGYARPGCFGLTNILGMEDVQSILAVGAGAVTKRVYGKSNGADAQSSLNAGRITRCGNVRNLEEYIARTDEMIARKEDLFSDRDVL